MAVANIIGRNSDMCDMFMPGNCTSAATASCGCAPVHVCACAPVCLFVAASASVTEHDVVFVRLWTHMAQPYGHDTMGCENTAQVI